MAHETAAALIRQERQRQIAVEGWTPEHDDEHADGQMLRAAVIYLHWGTDRAPHMNGDIPMGWPWDAQWWKPKDRISNLVRAGGLAQAERERIERANARREKVKEGVAFRNGDLSFSPLPAAVGHVDQKMELIVAALDAALAA